MISDPKQGFHYFISKNDRYVEMQREAMNGDWVLGFVRTALTKPPRMHSS
jgi:hypothetical protein